MKKLVMIFATTAALALSACGSEPEEATGIEQTSEPALPEVVVDRNFVGTAGRWATAEGALPEGRRIIIDIASNGRFSIDVRAPGANGEAIVESAKGSAAKEGSIVRGTTEAGPGAHAILKRYETWSLNTETGSITGTQNEPVNITKE